MNKINWTAVVVTILIVLIVLMVASSLFSNWSYGGWGYGPGWGMMGGMFFMWLIPLGFLALIVLGIAWLARNLGGSTPPPLARTCPNCGRGAQADWANCPYCGTALTK